jgi:hypothetical protein
VIFLGHIVLLILPLTRAARAATTGHRCLALTAGFYLGPLHQGAKVAEESQELARNGELPARAGESDIPDIYRERERVRERETNTTLGTY